MTIVPVDQTQHARDQVDGEDVVSISEETSTGYDNDADVVPSEGRLVDFGEGEAAALVGILEIKSVVIL